MEFGRYTHRMVVDLIWFEVRTAERHKFWTPQDALRIAQRLPPESKPFIQPFNDNGMDTNHASDVFRFPIQDPKSFQSVKAIIDDLDHEFHFVSPVKIISLEIAHDDYLARGTVSQLAQIACDRYRYSTHTPGNDWYLYRRKNEGRVYINELRNRRQLIQLLESGWQLTDTNSKSADYRRHGYVKTTDNGGDQLPAIKHRARDEVTLQGGALPCHTLQDLENFDFSSLASLFKYRRLDDDLHPMARYALTAWSAAQLGRPGLTGKTKRLKQHGQQRRYRRKHATIIGRYDGTSKFRGSTVADDRLNKEVRDQLRALTTAWRKCGVRILTQKK